MLGTNIELSTMTILSGLLLISSFCSLSSASDARTFGIYFLIDNVRSEYGSEHFFEAVLNPCNAMTYANGSIPEDAQVGLNITHREDEIRELLDVAAREVANFTWRLSRFECSQLFPFFPDLNEVGFRTPPELETTYRYMAYLYAQLHIMAEDWRVGKICSRMSDRWFLPRVFERMAEQWRDLMCYLLDDLPDPMRSPRPDQNLLDMLQSMASSSFWFYRECAHRRWRDCMIREHSNHLMARLLRQPPVCAPEGALSCS